MHIYTVKIDFQCMTKCETAVVAEVKKSLKKLSGSQVIDTLWEMGLLSKKGIERLAIERSY